MYITETSNKLYGLLTKYNNCLIPSKHNKKINTIFEKLYNDIHNGTNYINNKKINSDINFYNLDIQNINVINDIYFPSSFSSNAFPTNIKNHIEENALHSLIYHINIFDKTFNIFFIIENKHITSKLINKYNTYVDWMLVWMYIVNEYSDKNCGNIVNIYIYHTSLYKQLPKSNIFILSEENVNSAFTKTCEYTTEIVIFRKEEWFKVFIHESFHKFGLDFSNMDNTELHNKIRTIFPLSTQVNLYEAYTECWARIINALFCSYIYNIDKSNLNMFINNAYFFINMERIYSFFQAYKILNFMGLEYKNLYENNNISHNSRSLLYKENANVLAYYFITLILINNYSEFLLWCETNNTSKHLFNFKKTILNQNKFYKFIEKYYNSKKILNGFDCAEILYNNLDEANKRKKRKDIYYMLVNLRMTLFELC